MPFPTMLLSGIVLFCFSFLICCSSGLSGGVFVHRINLYTALGWHPSRRFEPRAKRRVNPPESEKKMAIDIETMSREELEQLKKDIDKQIVARAAEEKKLALQKAEAAAAEFGFSLAELTGGESKRKGRPVTSGVVKFRNPADSTQTWSGRGRRPAWINELEAAGRLEDARI